MSVGIIAKLQGQLSFERLAIGDPRLGFDSAPPGMRRGSTDLGIPRPWVASDRENDLGTPSKARVEDGAQPFEQPLRRQVSEWITAGIGPIREVQADDGAPTPPRLRCSPLGVLRVRIAEAACSRCGLRRRTRGD
jgi:hypothetical protein